MASHKSKAQRIRVRIANPPEGCRDTTSLEHARRYAGRGIARLFVECRCSVWRDVLAMSACPGCGRADNTVGGELTFLHRRDESKGGKPEFEVVSKACENSHAGFLRYPMPSGVSGGMESQFPALARQGAGL